MASAANRHAQRDANCSSISGSNPLARYKMIDHYQRRLLLLPYKCRFPNSELATKVEAIIDGQFTVDNIMVELELIETDYKYSF